MIPQQLRDLPQWLVWRFEAHEEQGKKPRKMPYYADGGRRVGKQGDKRDRDRLVTYTEASRLAGTGKKYDGIGFAFLPGDGLAGIDLDRAFEESIDKDTGEVKRGAPTERTRGIVGACSSYTEISPSGNGLHIFVTTAEVGDFKSFKNNGIGVEVFCGAQYFTFTGQRFGDAPLEVKPIDEKTLRRLRATVRAKKPTPAGTSAGSSSPVDDDQKRADAALVYVPADDYQAWIDVGMALKHEFGDAGYSIWDRWSSRSAKYPGAEETRRRWATFNPSGAVTIATVFGLAKQGGYVQPRAPQRRQRTERPNGPGGDRPSAPPPEEPPPGGDDAGDPGNERPRIRWVQGELPQCVNQAEDALIKSGMRIYQRAGFLVRVVKRDTPSVRHYKRRPPGSLGLLTVDAPFLIEAFTKAADWEKFSKSEKGWVPMNAPEQAAVTYLSRRGQWNLPLLWSAISSPTLRPDGTVLQEPGYDTATQSWYDPCGIEFPKIPESPSREDADAALKVLRSAFATFPFESKADEAVALALALTALVRRSLPSAPLGGITAPVMASGKTLLADCIAILATGVSAPAMKYADTDEEATKTMLAVLAEGDQVVLIDNVERPLEGDTLCAVLTSEAYRQRVLGRTEMMSVPTTTLFLATGNHLVISGDLRTRALMCRLDPKVEHPEQRQFNVELREWITQQRPELVAAGLTIMRAFIATDQRVADHCKTWGRFERWSDMVRAPLMWLGCEDPCASLKDLEREDPERVELVRFIAAWEAVFGDEPHKASEAVDRVSKGRGDPLYAPSLSPGEEALHQVLREICRDRGGELNPKKLGHWMRAHADRIVSDPDTTKPRAPKRLVRAGEKDHTLLWKVEAMKT